MKWLKAIVVIAVLAAGGLYVVEWWMGRLPDRPYDLVDACAGKTYEDAKPYAGSGPHPIAIFKDDEDAVLQHETVFLDGNTTWKPSDPEKASEVQLVACLKLISANERTGATDCAYGPGGIAATETLPMLRATYQVRVYELRTHREIRSTRIEGLDTECRSMIIAGRKTRLLSEPTPDQWQNLLADLVYGNR
ncbi:hypothetical protein [Kribbella sp. NPDC048915]|uniref:hypothetical protein n=1 Tax=Kribbella sp. NPDC048915 TaxID=3155148 RepID=UPI0033D18DDD